MAEDVNEGLAEQLGRPGDGGYGDDGGISARFARAHERIGKGFGFASDVNPSDVKGSRARSLSRRDGRRSRRMAALEQEQLLRIQEAAGGGESLEEVLRLDDGMIDAVVPDLFPYERGVVRVDLRQDRVGELKVGFGVV